jgi:hypothetical protein
VKWQSFANSNFQTWRTRWKLLNRLNCRTQSKSR